ncbi:MAG TPA: hypothetical protein VJZ06_02520 [Mobilitalea sp.]|nr:hypothetical protein [Mobilitalea sp.]
MATLYTGFKGARNSSYILVSQFSGEKLFLTNSFSGLRNDIENLRQSYDKVYMFGLDKTLRNSVRIEECAQKDGRALYTAIKSNEIVGRLMTNGICCSTSNNHTHYLCNEAYYYMLEKYERNAILIHIPPSRFISKEFSDSILNTL